MWSHWRQTGERRLQLETPVNGMAWTNARSPRSYFCAGGCAMRCIWFTVAGGMTPFMRPYSTICP